MLKKLIVGVLVLLLVASAAVFLLARSVFGRDVVRETLEDQIAQAIGQPVAIGSIGASIYPRVTVDLGDVRIGDPPRIHAQTLHVGTSFRALLSRRIEQARLRLDDARIELPLPPLRVGVPAPSTGSSSEMPVEIVSIDEIVLDDVEVVSGGRTLRADVELVPENDGLTVRRVSVTADDTTLEASGRIDDLSGPVGELTIRAGELNANALLAFFSDFSSGAGLPEASPAAPTGAATAGTPMKLAVNIEAARATSGDLAIDQLSGRALVTDEAVAVDPLSFGLFGGRYEGGLTLALAGERPAYEWNAKLSNLDMAAATAFAGSPDTITGRLSGNIALSGQGIDPGAAMQTARGTAQLEITDGIVRNLGLLRSIVLATSMRAASTSQATAASRDEPFSRLGATLAVAGGSASTSDLQLDSENLLLAAAGALRLDGSALNFQGRVQLSEELSKQAGTDLLRYTADQGRVTLPVTVSGPAANPSVRVDVADMTKRAIQNRATEEAGKAIKKGLGGLIKRP